MSNRVIKDSIWTSPSLAKLPVEAQLHWPRLLLMADDWGCFNADTDVIRGLAYPKMESMTKRKIKALLQIYYEAGMLFLWAENDREWGYFTAWNGHQYCNATNLDDSGRQQKHRRKTPEPLKNDLEAYLDTYLYKKQVVSEKLEQVRTVRNKLLNPIPIPIPIPTKTHIHAPENFSELPDTGTEPEPKAPTDTGTEPEPKTGTQKLYGSPELKAALENFKKIYPCPNGKFPQEQKVLCNLGQWQPEDIPKILLAARNYADSRRVRDGVGIRDPKNFIGLPHLPDPPWQEWLEPEKPPVQKQTPAERLLDEARAARLARERQSGH